MEEKNKLFLKVVAIDMILLCYSFNVAIIGQMFEPLKKTYSLSMAQTSMLPSIQSIGGFISVLICILFLDSLNKQKVVVASAIVYYALFMLIGVTPPLVLLFGVFIMMGMSGGAVDTLTNSVMVDTAPRNTEKYVNFMHTLYALGAVLAPMLSQYIYSFSGLKGAFLIMGGFALVCALYSAFAFKQEIQVPLIKRRTRFTEQLKGMITVYKKPGMVEVGILAVFFSCWQLAAALYVSSLITGISKNPADGAFALSAFFLGIMLARLIYTRFAGRFPEGLVLAVSNFLGMLSWVSAMLVPGIVAKTILIGLAAFFCGNDFPVNITAACKIAPQNTAAASGTVILGYFISSFVFPPIIGALGDAMGISRALIFAAVPLLLVVPIALQLHRKMKATYSIGLSQAASSGK